jgi:hypothetical protein
MRDSAHAGHFCEYAANMQLGNCMEFGHAECTPSLSYIPNADEVSHRIRRLRGNHQAPERAGTAKRFTMSIPAEVVGRFSGNPDEDIFGRVTGGKLT